MIPRLHPLFVNHSGRFPFGTDEAARRPLRIVIDTASVVDGEAISCLREFGHHPDIEILETGGGEFGRLTIGELAPGEDHFPVQYDVGDGTHFTGVWPAKNLLSFADALGGDTRENRTALVLRRAASSADADCLVSQLETLLDGHIPPDLRETAPMSAEQACAVLGLYMRTRSNSSIECAPKWKLTMPPGTFYFVLRRELLVESWRWFSGCVAYGDAHGDDELRAISQSGLERFDSALRARDLLHALLQPALTRPDAEEIAFYFDVATLMLDGAFDAVTNVGQEVAGHLTGTRHGPTVAALLKLSNPVGTTRKIVDILRNTIHGEAISHITVSDAGRLTTPLVIPTKLVPRLQKLLRAKGGEEGFGVEVAFDGKLRFDPGIFLEQLLPHVVDALNALMAATPIDQLPGVKETGLLMAGPPPDDDEYGRGMLDHWTRQRVRLLGGFAV